MPLIKLVSMFDRFCERANLALLYMISALRQDTWRQLTACDVLLVRHDHNCGYTYHGQAYAHLVDSFGDLCERRRLTVGSVAIPFSKLVGERAYHSPVFYNQSLIHIYLAGIIVRLLNGGNRGKAWIASQRVDLWCRILERAKPRCVIAIEPQEDLCQAGKRLKIPVYDLQHGVIEGQKYRESYGLETPVEKLPDGYLCWDDHSAAAVSGWATKRGIRVLTIGNPWFLRFIRARSDDLLVREALAGGEILNDDRPCILVSLTWAFAQVFYPDGGSNGVMEDSLERVILDTAESYNWVLRLHPVQLRGRERERVVRYLLSTFGAERTQYWLSASEIPLPVVLMKVQLHITNESAVVTEAAWSGVRSGVISDRLGRDGKYPTLFSYERSTGMAEILPRDAGAIRQWISLALAKERVEPIPATTSRNLEAFIEEIAGLQSE
jgi:hypothetical protein